MAKWTSNNKTHHRFLDEAGDTTFYGKKRIPIVGSKGVSKCFILGLVNFRDPIAIIRRKVIDLQRVVESDPYYRGVPSLEKRKRKGGFFFHATDDQPEVRKTFFEFIKRIDCTYEAVVARKIPELYESKHHRNDAEFYADMLSHLLKNKFQDRGNLAISIAQRGTTTRNSVFEVAVEIAAKRYSDQREGEILKPKILFNVQNHRDEPLLNVADYFCWALQRLFETGETRYYDFLKEKFSSVLDLYDQQHYDSGTYYDHQSPLTAKNKISPP